jgi:hypothetical protein
MARPDTLCEAVGRVADGEPQETVWAGLLDQFYGVESPEGRRHVLKTEPALTGDARLDCLAAATAEYLWKQYRLGSPLPRWIGQPDRILPEPWFTTSLTAPGIREYLSFASPAEFIHHNIFTDEAPLRRARQC